MAVVWVFLFGFFVALAGAPLALALAPAAVSTRCDELKDGLTMLRAKDLEGQAGRIDALYNFLDHVNNKQGIGFAMGGGVSATVVDKKYLTQTAFTVYAVLGALVPTLLASLEPVEGMPSGSPLCPYSWAETDGMCFKLFGNSDASMESEFLPMTWPEAEAHCKQYGSNLARISSEFHNDAVLKLSAGTTVWIGLSAAASEGVWAWSDGEPVSFTDWGGNQGVNNGRGNGGDQSGDFSTCEDGECVFIYDDQKWHDEGCGTGLLENGTCGATWGLPFICSKPSSPGTRTHMVPSSSSTGESALQVPRLGLTHAFLSGVQLSRTGG